MNGGEALVVDGTCPGDHWFGRIDDWIAGGASCCVVTVGGTEDCRSAVAAIGELLSFVRARPEKLMLAETTAAIETARRQGTLAVVLQFQGTQPLEYDVNLVEVYRRLGVRMIQLAYNRRGPLCDGCEEPRDAGLSRLGRAVVVEMNRLGLVVDVSHTGTRSALEAISLSTAPVVASHSNAASIHPSRRKLSDELIRAIAVSGGLIGANGFPAFVNAHRRPTLDHFIDHIDHIAELVGPEHVALGLDYWITDPPPGLYESLIRTGEWGTETYPPPPWRYPEGLESAAHFPALSRRLGERGFTEGEVAGIMGENWIRVFDQIWS